MASMAAFGNKGLETFVLFPLLKMQIVFSVGFLEESASSRIVLMAANFERKPDTVHRTCAGAFPV